MEHDDREYTDILNDELKDIEPGDGLHGKVRDRIAGSVVRARRRNTALGVVAVAIVLTMVLSTVTPVFGRNGTLPQVIMAMAAERQAQKMTKTLGTATVQQTSAALLVPEATVQTVADSTLSETDSILALVIADRAGRPVGEVVALRSQGLGWGVIMAQLGISGHDISEAVGQAQAVAVARTTDKPAVSNRDGNKVVVNGEITAVFPVFPATLTVAGKTFAIVADTQLKYHGKAITPPEIFTKLLAGKLYATVQGTELADKSLRANLIIVQDVADSTQEDQEQPKASNEQQIRGRVVLVVPTPPTLPTLLRVQGFDHDIVLNTATKVEQVGAGKSTLADITVGQTVQVHVSLTGTTYTATQVHIEDKYVKPDESAAEDQQTDPSVKTWQGTIASTGVGAGVNPFSEQTIGLVVLAESGQPTFYWVLPTSVLQDASHHTLTLPALQTLQSTAVRKVTIQGRLLADGTVDIVKLTVTTVNTTTTPEPTNPGKGNGKH